MFEKSPKNEKYWKKLQKYKNKKIKITKIKK